jgi:hypothetical protein
MSRKARRSQKFEVARPSPKLRLFLEPLDQRLVPSSAAIVSQSGNTLTITEYTAFSDIITETSAFGGKYTITTSANSGNPQNFSNVSNIVFNAATSGISVLFNSSGGTFNTTGNVSLNSTTNFVGTFIEFDGTQNVSGALTIAQTGIGDTTDFYANGAHFGSLTVTGGSAINSSNSGNTFVSVSDTIHNASGNTSIKGTMVDLEGVTVAGATTINFGAGGGYFLTDYTIDLGNGSNDATSGAATVSFGGNLSITDLRSRTEDTFGMYNANVGGNLSINVSSIGADEYLYISNYNISKNATVAVNGTADVYDYVDIYNSTLQGNTSFTEVGAYYGVVDLYNTSINGSVTVNQSNEDYSEFDVNGSSSLAAVTVKQAGYDDFVGFNNVSAIKGAVSATQTGTYYNNFSMTNDGALSSTLTVTQSPSDNSIDIYNVSNISGLVTLNQSVSQESAYAYVQNSTLSGGLNVTQTTHAVSSGGEAYFEADYSTIAGNVSIKQGSGLGNEVFYWATTQTNGSLTINQSTGLTYYNYVYLENGSSINGSVGITQTGNAAEDYVYAGLYDATNNSSAINGSVTVTQSGYDGYVYLGNVGTTSYINSSLTVTQNVTDESYLYVEGTSIKGAVKATQTGVYGAEGYIYNSSVNSSVTFSQNQVGYYMGFEIYNSSVNGSVSLTQATGVDYAYAELNYAQVNGSVTFTHGINGGGSYAEGYIYNSAVLGNVSIIENGGYYNDVYIYNASISGTLTINQSGATNYYNDVYINDSSSINGSVSITEAAASYDQVVIDDGAALKSTLTIKQTAITGNTVYINNSSVTSTITATMGSGYGEFGVYNSSLTGNVSVNSNSALGTDVYFENSSLSKNLTVVGGTGALAYDEFYLENVAVIGNITVNISGSFNYVDIYDSTVFGTTALNLGIGQTANNSIYIQSDSYATSSTSFQGALTAGMGDGTNTVHVGENGSVSFLANSSFAANISGYNTYDSSNTSGSGVVTFRNF